MGAKSRARQLLPLPENSAVKAGPLLAATPQALPTSAPNPTRNGSIAPPLRLAALYSEAQPRRFARVPTHAVGVHPEHREYPRATLQLPLRLRSVNKISEEFPVTLVTR